MELDVVNPYEQYKAGANADSEKWYIWVCFDVSQKKYDILEVKKIFKYISRYLCVTFGSETYHKGDFGRAS